MVVETKFDREKFDKLAAEYRYVITDMICRAASGHLGGALSLVEIIITLYYRVMKIDPKNHTFHNYTSKLNNHEPHLP